MLDMREVIIKNEKETEKFAKELAEKFMPGTVLALTGDLGTGKTTLTKYLAKNLGIEDTITSPTFTIIQEYKSGRLPLYHFDVYRISDDEEMFELGYEEYFFGDGVCIVEWADIIEDLIPEDALRIDISYGNDEQERIYRCSF